MFVILNRGKKSVTLNLKSKEGLKIAKELTKQADVVIENFSTGTMEDLGIGYEELRKIKPSLISASITGFGHTGPEAYRLAYDMLAQARGGLMSVTGFKNSPPTKSGPGIADFLGGVFAMLSILTALRHRDATGHGQAIDISLMDCIWLLTSIESLGYYTIKGIVPERMGNEALPTSPSGSFATGDGWVVLNVPTNKEWTRLMEAIGHKELINDPRLLNNDVRANHRDEVNALITGWTEKHTTAEVVSALSKAGVACAAVSSFDQVVNDPQLLSRGMITQVIQELSGALKVPGSIFKLSETPGDPTMPAPTLGQHNHDILSGMLGYSDESLARLAAEGVI